MSTNGSGLFTKDGPAVPHLSDGELKDLRDDVARALKPMASITVDEFTNPLTAAAAGLLAATPTPQAPLTVLEATLLAPGKAELAANPRNLTFTTGGTAADAPLNVLITGFDAAGKAQTETVALAQTAATVAGVKAFSKVTKLEFAAGDGTFAATVSVGFGVVLGLKKTPKVRAGLAAPVHEVAAGAIPGTAGVLSATNKTYTPNAAPNNTNDYAVFYEYDPLV